VSGANTKHYPTAPEPLRGDPRTVAIAVAVAAVVPPMEAAKEAVAAAITEVEAARTATPPAVTLSYGPPWAHCLGGY
jgi:hypothetical protein